MLVNSYCLNDYWKNISKWIWFTDQMALALCFVDQKLKVKPLSDDMHFHCANDTYPWADKMEPYIMHYHGHVENNKRLKMTVHTMPNQYVEKVNKIL